MRNAVLCHWHSFYRLSAFLIRRVFAWFLFQAFLGAFLPQSCLRAAFALYNRRCHQTLEEYMKRSCIAALLVICLAHRLAAQELSAADLAARTELWPREVTLTAALPVPLIIDGKNVGTASLPAGTRLTLNKVEGQKAHLTFNGSATVTEVANTDLLARAQQKLRQLEYQNKMVTATPVSGTTASTPAAAPAPLGKIAKALSGSLVALKNGNVANYDDANLAKVKYYAIYFSASWCPPCRKFTPGLVSFYNQIKPKNPDFELVFASSDRSGSDMEKYMQGDSMPWPAIRFGELKNKPAITEFAGRGIPCLVFIDENGKILSNSYEGGKYVGPNKVLRDIESTLAKR